MDLELENRVVLVTGSHRGTGAATAAVFAAEGARVVVHGFEPGQADVVAEDIRADGGSAIAVHGDLSSVGEVDRFVGAVEEQLGPVEVLVNNYGAPGSTSWDTPADEWHAGWETNVLTAVRVTQRCLGAMRGAGWGRVVFLGTVGTEMPGRKNPDYYGAKSSVPALVRSLAQELRGSGVTANLVSPGMIATAEVKAMVERQFERAHGRASEHWEEAEQWALSDRMANLTGALAAPEDIGRVVAFVASGPAWHVHGADIKVDGGARDA